MFRCGMVTFRFTRDGQFQTLTYYRHKRPEHRRYSVATNISSVGVTKTEANWFLRQARVSAIMLTTEKYFSPDTTCKGCR